MLVGHGIRDVIQDDAKRESGKFLGILRAVGPLPGVAEVHVGTDRDHDSTPVVADGAPLWHVAVLFISAPGSDVNLARDLKLFVDVV